MNAGYETKVKAWLRANKVSNPFTDSLIGTKLELIELGKRLNDNEDIVYLTACKLNDKRVLVCVTDARLIILDKGLVYNYYQYTVFLDDIANIERGRTFYFGYVTVYLKGNDVLKLEGFWADDTEEFYKQIEQARYNLKFGIKKQSRVSVEERGDGVYISSRNEVPKPKYADMRDVEFGGGFESSVQPIWVMNSGASAKKDVKRPKTEKDIARINAKRKAYRELEEMLKLGMIDVKTFNERALHLKER